LCTISGRRTRTRLSGGLRFYVFEGRKRERMSSGRNIEVASGGGETTAEQGAKTRRSGSPSSSDRFCQMKVSKGEELTSARKYKSRWSSCPTRFRVKNNEGNLLNLRDSRVLILTGRVEDRDQFNAAPSAAVSKRVS